MKYNYSVYAYISRATQIYRLYRGIVVYICILEPNKCRFIPSAEVQMCFS